MKGIIWTGNLVVFRARNCFDEFEHGGLHERRRKKRM
jgi:hypothetical protein